MGWPSGTAGTGWGSAPPAGDAGPSDAASVSARRRARGSVVVAIALFVVAAVVFTCGLSGHGRWLAGPLFTSTGPAPQRISPMVRSVPLTLSIPAIGIKVPLSQLGLNPNHTVQVPTNFREPGWYEFGPSPGQIGSAVILGHVDSYLGPAVFFRLRDLRPGDHVDVTLADGVVTHFVVRQVAEYPKAHFPTTSVYGQHGYSALQLVTCGGVFDTQARSYLSNVVVYTSLASAS